MNSPFEKRVCYTVCICQLTAVLSCVSIVYLTVAVYSPSYKILSSDFSENPVMCTTIANKTPEDCDSEAGIGGGGGWNSCSEWCLSKSSGSCPRIMVDVRQNGSNLMLEECEAVETIWCHGIDPNKKLNECYRNDCAGMTGLFNCTIPTMSGGIISTDGAYGSRCRDLTSILECAIVNLEKEIHCQDRRNCLKLQGLYKCQVGDCSKVLGPYICKKRCVGIRTGEKSIIIRHGDVIFSANCGRVRNIDTDKEIWPLDYKSKTKPELPPTLLMFCTDLYMNEKNNGTFRVSDCFNGTLLEPDLFGWNTTIDILQQTHVDAIEKGMNERDASTNALTSLVGPTESDLLIYNNTRLYINYESCVNTLILNECEKFYEKYGGDGSDLRTNSRFQCFYSPSSPLFATLRFSRWTTLMELMLATVIPISLAIISCFTLVLCTRIIHVGDDSHFYFQCCGSENKAILEKESGEAMAL